MKTSQTILIILTFSLGLFGQSDENAKSENTFSYTFQKFKEQIQNNYEKAFNLNGSQISNGSSLVVNSKEDINKIEIALNDPDGSTIKEVVITTHFGNVMKTYDIANKSSIVLDVSNLLSGQTYLIVATSNDGGSFIERFMKA